MPDVWVVMEYVAFEGDRVVDVFATKERADRFIANKERNGKMGPLRPKRWKVRGGHV